MAGAAQAQRAALRHGQVRRLTAGFFAVTLGEWVLGTAIAVGLVEQHGALIVALVGARFVPAAAASLVAGSWADRAAPRTVLITSAAGRALCAAAAAALAAAGAPLPLIALAVWSDAAVGAAYRPAQARLLPAVAGSPAELGASTTLLSTAKSAAQVLGALLGSMLGAVLAASAGAAVAVALFAGAALLAVRLATDARRVARRDSGSPLASLGVLARHPGSWRVMAWSGARAASRGAWTSLGVLAAASLLHLGPGGFGVLMVAAGGGTIVGVAVAGGLVGRPHLTPALASALAATALALLTIGLSGRAAIALPAMVLWGAGMAVADVAAQALLTRVVTPSDTGRVVGVVESGKLLAEGLGGVIAPIAAAALGLREALVGLGLLLIGLLAADAHGFRRLDARAVGRVDLLDLARGVPLFAPLRLDGLEAVVAPLQPRTVEAGQIIIEQDSAGSEWFLVRSGECVVEVDGFGVGRLGPGEAFGERGLMLNEPRMATVRTLTRTDLLVLERDDFLRALTGTVSTDGAPMRERAAGSREEVVASQPLLHRVEPGVIQRLAAEAEERRVSTGEWLCQQGDPSDAWLVVLSGKVAVFVDGVQRRTLGMADSLGEIGVLHGVPRTASAQAQEPTTVLAIPADALRVALADAGVSPAPA